MRGDKRIAHDHGARERQQRREQRAGIAQHARTDVDRVASLAQRDMLRRRHDRQAPNGSGSAASSSREKRAISSRLVSTTAVATSRYSESRAE